MTVWLRTLLICLSALAFAGFQIACACVHGTASDHHAVQSVEHADCHETSSMPMDSPAADTGWTPCEHADQLKSGTSQVQLAQVSAPVELLLPLSYVRSPGPALVSEHERPEEIRPPPPDPPSARKTVFRN